MNLNSIVLVLSNFKTYGERNEAPLKGVLWSRRSVDRLFLYKVKGSCTSL